MNFRSLIFAGIIVANNSGCDSHHDSAAQSQLETLLNNFSALSVDHPELIQWNAFSGDPVENNRAFAKFIALNDKYAEGIKVGGDGLIYDPWKSPYRIEWQDGELRIYSNGSKKSRKKIIVKRNFPINVAVREK